MNEQRSFNGGYLFLQRLYHDLKLHHISQTISDKYKFSFNFDSILSKTYVTNDGEIANNEMYHIDHDVITKEEDYDEFYAVCINLEDDAPAITRINHKRWEVEECFRLLKTDLRRKLCI